MSVERIVRYHVRWPGRLVYLQSDNPTNITFTKFSDNALELTEFDAKKIASEYSLDVVKRVTTITTEELIDF